MHPPSYKSQSIANSPTLHMDHIAAPKGSSALLGLAQGQERLTHWHQALGICEPRILSPNVPMPTDQPLHGSVFQRMTPLLRLASWTWTLQGLGKVGFSKQKDRIHFLKIILFNKINWL